jgi:hypothetical protein
MLNSGFLENIVINTLIAGKGAGMNTVLRLIKALSVKIMNLNIFGGIV